MGAGLWGLQKPDGSQHERGNHHEFATRVRQDDGRPHTVHGVDCQTAAAAGLRFHRLTQSLSLLVLVALLGIIVSLFIYAWPAFPQAWHPVHLAR